MEHRTPPTTTTQQRTIESHQQPQREYTPRTQPVEHAQPQVQHAPQPQVQRAPPPAQRQVPQRDPRTPAEKKKDQDEANGHR